MQSQLLTGPLTASEVDGCCLFNLTSSSYFLFLSLLSAERINPWPLCVAFKDLQSLGPGSFSFCFIFSKAYHKNMGITHETGPSSWAEEGHRVLASDLFHALPLNLYRSCYYFRQIWMPLLLFSCLPINILLILQGFNLQEAFSCEPSLCDSLLCLGSHKCVFVFHYNLCSSLLCILVCSFQIWKPQILAWR